MGSICSAIFVTSASAAQEETSDCHSTLLPCVSSMAAPSVSLYGIFWTPNVESDMQDLPPCAHSVCNCDPFAVQGPTEVTDVGSPCVVALCNIVSVTCVSITREELLDCSSETSRDCDLCGSANMRVTSEETERLGKTSHKKEFAFEKN